MSRGRATLSTLIAGACLIAACSHAQPRPAGHQWGLPVYPGAVVVGKSTAKASFVLYRTGDPVSSVDAWYAAELPHTASHAYDAAHDRSTFALFGARDRRTVHIERDGDHTAIMLTDLATP